MSRLIDADALIADVTERYCKDCNKRKGMKNGKLRIIYEIGEVPCRACDVDDMKIELDDAPTVDAVPVVRCKDCKFFREHLSMNCVYHISAVGENWFCSQGKKVTE